MVAVGGIVYFPSIFKFTFSIKHMYKYADGLDIGGIWIGLKNQLRCLDRKE